MEAQNIPIHNDQGGPAYTNVLHDSASSITLCRHDWAENSWLRPLEYHNQLINTYARKSIQVGY